MTSNQQKFELHFAIDSRTLNAVDAIAEHIPTDSHPISKAEIKQAMAKGCTWLSRKKNTLRLHRGKKPLQIHDEIHFYFDPQVLAQQPVAPQLIADLEDYSVWFKPYGVYSQGSKWSDHCTIDRLVSLQLNRHAAIVHRLDRATSGLMLIAHNKKTAAALSQLFAQRTIDKNYIAIVAGEFPSSEKPVRIETEIDGKQAVSEVAMRSYDAEQQQSKVFIKIETGRKHQVRRHLSELGFPIIGDRLYGTAKTEDENLKLCCQSLAFICPISGEPKHFQLQQAMQVQFSSHPLTNTRGQ
ncbi:RluA family pseudouridine synthase [Oceanicoccus sp. KOV_DT_Chl]|uniref:RluA family pseudouridine synthase n=1 Tax=Oceanicoccus sp. KOV_DT_Chl TaxID=1904639 RepID=UPI000C7B7AD8|nr:RluA family pseudouridine synthase [Oceanicoccus sp. KOV_DT_Chl]